MQLGHALVTVTYAIYVLEASSGELPDETRDLYDQAFADVGRLFANVTGGVLILIADHPDAIAAARAEPAERKIWTP